MKRGVCVLLLAAALTTAAAVALEPPLPVSPGHARESLQIGDRCPTFTWGWQADARFFELVVYRIDDGGRDSESSPAIRVRVPGSAAAWTPALDSCLQDGERYAWSLRTFGDEETSDWSMPSLFQVTAAPTEAEFEKALAVVERYLEDRGRRSGAPAAGPFVTSMQPAGRAVDETSDPQPGPAATGSRSAAASGSGAAIFVDGAVVETKAAAACIPSSAAPDSVDRYVDCGNGTVLDTVTGLLWLQQADCLGSEDWWDAHAAVASLAAGLCGLSDDSQPADWRLPTKEEWQATVGQAVASGCTVAGSSSPPSLMSDPGLTCFAVGPTSFAGVQVSDYWSSSTRDVEPATAWSASLDDGAVEASAKSELRRVWAVRGGPPVSWATYR